MPGTVGICGTGLIGASIGLGLGRMGWTVTGWDPNPEILQQAQSLSAIHETADSYEHLVALPTDVIVLAGPPSAVIAQAATLETGALVLDVAGVKNAVVADARPERFVGTHPMAGREVTGPQGASPSLFRGATWVIVTDGAEERDLQAAEEILAELGAEVVRMTAAQHDAAVAMISHLPQLSQFAQHLVGAMPLGVVGSLHP